MRESDWGEVEKRGKGRKKVAERDQSVCRQWPPTAGVGEKESEQYEMER